MAEADQQDEDSKALGSRVCFLLSLPAELRNWMYELASTAAILGRHLQPPPCLHQKVRRRHAAEAGCSSSALCTKPDFKQVFDDAAVDELFRKWTTLQIKKLCTHGWSGQRRLVVKIAD